MKEKKSRISGGLVLKTKELINIINEPDATGIAFGVAKRGISANVDLLVYKVFRMGGEFVGDLRKVADKYGAANVSSEVSNVESFNFEYKKKLKECGFDFAYLKKEEFNRVTRNGAEKEVFISGVIQDYGNLGNITGEWFTLKIEPKKTIGGKEKIVEHKKSLRLLNNEPNNHFMPPCPPFWTKGIDPIESGAKDRTRIIFSEQKVVEES